MSTTTTNLGLFKYNTTTDANTAFNINKALNNNWDKLDSHDNNVVHKTGTEEIAGIKVFIDEPTIVTNDTTTLHIKNNEADWTQNSTANNLVSRIFFKDKNNIDTGFIQTYKGINTDTRGINIGARSKDNNSWTTLGIEIDDSGNSLAYAPTYPNALVNNDIIATTAWVNNFTNSILHINGDKIFHNYVETNRNLTIKHSGITWEDLRNDIIGDITFKDSANKMTGYLHSFKDLNGTGCMTMACADYFGSFDYGASISIGRTLSGINYTYAPACDWINSLVTTIGINKNPNGYVRFGNGILLQWGQISGQGWQTVYYPVAFTDWNTYSIVKNYNHNGDTGLMDREGSFTTLTTTSAVTFKASGDGNYSQWLAMGY